MTAVETAPEAELLAAAQRGDSAAFDRLVSRHRRALRAHCYRMLGSVQDAEDALQEALLGAWKGLGPFEGRSSFRSWLYRVTTNACLRLQSRRPRRLLSSEHAPARTATADLGEPVLEPIWIEPWVDGEDGPESATSHAAAFNPAALDPAARAVRRESLELAFIAALQHLPGQQRAALLLCEVLEFSAAEAAELLDSTLAAVNSALQRARRSLAERNPGASQQTELAKLGAAGQQQLVTDFIRAWEASDLDALLRLLTKDARFLMPPLPAWFDGRENVGRFFSERVFASSWRLVPMRVNEQLGFACYMVAPGTTELGLSALNSLKLRGGRVAEIDACLDPAVLRSFGLPAVLAT